MRNSPGALLLVLALSAVLSRGDQNAVMPSPPEGTSITATQREGPVADNSRCFVCHANYDSEEEKLTVVHAKANIGCVRCHGESSPHSTDEDGLTAPDLMFAKSRIRFNCLGCHDWVKLVASDRKKTECKEEPDHLAVLNGTVTEKRFCTDCHGGEHRMSYRTRTWDKRTRKLLSRDATPKMLSDPSGAP